MLQPGTFRTLRLVKFLPEHGWRPVVVAVDRATIPSYVLCDEALLAHVAPETPVIRAPVLRPYDTAVQWVKSGWYRAVHAPPFDSEPPQDPGPSPPGTGSAGIAAGKPAILDRAAADGQSSNRPRLRGLALRSQRWRNACWSRFERVRDRLFYTPDTEVGWFRPAVAAGMLAIKQYRPAVIYVSAPPHSAHRVGVELKRRTGLPLVLDLRDPWARLPWQSDESDSSLRRLIQHLESDCVRAADRVILNTEHALHDFRAYYRDLPRERFLTISNGYDPEVLTQVAHVRKADSDRQPKTAGGCEIARTDPASLTRTIRLCHAGGVYGKRDLRPFLHAIARANDLSKAKAADADPTHAKFFFHQVGHVDQLPEIQALIEARRLGEHVEFEVPVPHAQALERLHAADVLVVLQTGTSLQLPSKIFEMILFGKPILALAPPGATADLVRKYQLGEVADAESVDDILRALGRLSSLQNFDQHHAGWQAALRDFHGGQLVEKFAELFDGVRRVRK